jgi:hypothetical protein
MPLQALQLLGNGDRQAVKTPVILVSTLPHKTTNRNCDLQMKNLHRQNVAKNKNVTSAAHLVEGAETTSPGPNPSGGPTFAGVPATSQALEGLMKGWVDQANKETDIVAFTKALFKR